MSEPITWTNTTVKLSHLQPWEGNPKTSTAKNVKQLQVSRDELGQFQTVAIGPPNGSGLCPVYDGHQRLSSWQIKYGPNSEIAARQSSRPLTDEERRKVAIYSRQIGAWDWDTLSNWDASELAAWGFDTDLLGDWRRDVAALGNFIESQEEEPKSKDAEPQTSRAEELREEWGVELGQMWRLLSRVEGQEHRLICGDASVATIVSKLNVSDVEIILSDPPYSSGGFQEAQRKSGSIGNRQNKQIVSDQLSTRGYLSLMSEVLNNVAADVLYLFTDWRMWCWTYDIAERANYPVRNMLVWDKGHMGMGFPWRSTHELVLFAKRTSSQMMDGKTGNVLRYDRASNKEHPTAKPIELVEAIINNSPDGSIYDPFVGAGTTIIAAENLARQCRAVEIAPGYVAVALQRYYDAFGIRAELVD